VFLFDLYLRRGFLWGRVGQPPVDVIRCVVGFAYPGSWGEWGTVVIIFRFVIFPF